MMVNFHYCRMGKFSLGIYFRYIRYASNLNEIIILTKFLQCHQLCDQTYRAHMLEYQKKIRKNVFQPKGHSHKITKIFTNENFPFYSIVVIMVHVYKHWGGSAIFRGKTVLQGVRL